MNDLSEKDIEKNLKSLLPTKNRWHLQELAEKIWSNRSLSGSGPGHLKGRILTMLRSMKRRKVVGSKGTHWHWIG